MKSKKFNKLFLFFFLLPVLGFAQQKIGFMDSESIMKQLPEAQDAQKKIDILIQNWKDEISDMEKDFKAKFDTYDKRKLIMSDQSRAQSEKELQELDKKIMDYRTQKFGQNGELSKKQIEAVKPIQDKIFQALQEIAKEEKYDFVFDKSGQLYLLITSEKYDLTALVLERFNKLKTTTTPTSN
jgi:outer membrane protein